MEIPVPLQGKSIHVVDGDADMRKAYERMLREFLRAGATIKTHASPEEFFNAVRPEQLPDVLISGYVFQGDLSGTQLADKLRLEGFGGAFILASGYRGYEVSGSIDDVLDKPFETVKLQRLVLNKLIG